jgi:AcrR family transcriptional regulator
MARPYLSESQITDQRCRLTQAALTLYRTRGYEALTLRGVAAQVGMSHFTPYRYFKSKDDLLAAIKTEVFLHFEQHLQIALDPLLAPIERLRRLCVAVVDYARLFPDDYRLIFALRQPPTRDYPDLQAVWRRTAEFVISACQEAIDAGQLQGDAITWAHVAWSAIHGLVSLHVANLLVLDRDIESLIEPILRALLPVPQGLT